MEKKETKKHQSVALWTTLALLATIFGPIAFYIFLYNFFGPSLSTLE